jgi:MFS family permease
MARISPQAAVATVFVAAMFITIIDATVVNVALPTIAADLGVPVELTATVNIGFLVAVAVAIPVAGWLGDRWGAREVFLAAVALFTVASAACGFAATVQQLVIFRIVQGLGGGLMTPVGMAMLYRTFPPSERIRLSRIINIPIALAPAIGPVLGGFLVQRASWRWISGSTCRSGSRRWPSRCWPCRGWPGAPAPGWTFRDSCWPQSVSRR